MVLQVGTGRDSHTYHHHQFVVVNGGEFKMLSRFALHETILHKCMIKKPLGCFSRNVCDT